MTRRVSESPISSSRSAEISSTARPSRRASRIWSQICACAPTSTPRVGCAAISSFGAWLISRPTISFCWLPPESEAAVTSMPGVRTSYSRTIRSVSARAALRSRNAPLLLGRSVTWPRMRFSQSGASSSSPCRWRSSGMTAMPSSRRLRVGVREMSTPSRVSTPVSRWRMPMMASTSSDWPLPSTPAMPRTSPLWMVKVMPSSTARTTPSGSVAVSRRSSTVSIGVSVTVDSRVSGDGSSLPTISSASCLGVVFAGSAVPTVVPRRMTVISSATDSTSPSLCEMKMTVRPSALSSRRLSKSASTSCGTRTAVGSSRIRVRAPR